MKSIEKLHLNTNIDRILMETEREDNSFEDDTDEDDQEELDPEVHR